MNPHFQHPFTCIVSAPTKSGKSELVKRLIFNSKQMIEPPPEIIYWAYTEWQKGYDELNADNRVKFIEGVPDLDELKNRTKIKLKC